ncbi:hypothetical protein R3W88_000361 [Solanum pinnatisectum]|uniref:F-box domain-containing protein n=1 Tax=Solanum pinnatisectum TaxID=50273 RepID=A0AAV9MHT3_9SOLN|nr:hypothetical protein R3W88_000361 [Solanum pinnatisectum]
MGIDFQEEILMDILSRLLVLPLLRFKCVSKFWKRLISDAYLNMKHQRHHKNDLNSQKILVTVHMVTFFSSFSLSTVQLVEDVQNFDCPTNCIPDHYSNIYGSCNGLVLVDIYNRYDKQLLLWNPSTRDQPYFLIQILYQGVLLSDWDMIQLAMTIRSLN